MWPIILHYQQTQVCTYHPSQVFQEQGQLPQLRASSERLGVRKDQHNSKIVHIHPRHFQEVLTSARGGEGGQRIQSHETTPCCSF